MTSEACRHASAQHAAVTETISGPDVETVSPPNSGQANCLASSPSAAANGVSQASSAPRKASVFSMPLAWTKESVEFS